MYRYSQRSRKKMESCDARWVHIFETLAKFHNITIIEGERGRERQDDLFHTGESKVQWPNSKHNVIEPDKKAGKKSLAIDAALYFPHLGGIKWEDIGTARYFGGIVMGTAKIMYPDTTFRWGGDWNSDMDTSNNTFNDLWHLEIVE